MQWATMSPEHNVYDREKEPACVGILPNIYREREGNADARIMSAVEVADLVTLYLKENDIHKKVGIDN